MKRSQSAAPASASYVCFLHSLLAKETVHDNFDVLLGLVWLHSEAVERDYLIFSRSRDALRVRCVDDAGCAFRVNAKIAKRAARVTTSCLVHSCSADKRKRKRRTKSSVRQAGETARNGHVNVEKVVQQLLASWKRELISGGSNNSVRVSGIRRVAEEQHRCRPIVAGESVVLDFGSGAGIACCYYALRFGCRVVGVEYCTELVAIARRFAREANVDPLCTFYEADFTSLTAKWLTEQRVTHVFIFDGVFSAANWNSLFHNLLPGLPDGVVGASVSKFRNSWPDCIRECNSTTIERVGLASSTSSFSFRVWKRLKDE